MGKMYLASASPAQAQSRKRKKVTKSSKFVTRTEVKRMMDASEEFKAIYSTADDVTAYNAGAGRLVLLNGCNQGDGLSSREGREIRIRSVQINIQHRYSNASAPTTFNAPLRCLLVLDLEPHGATPVLSDILRITDGQAYDEAPRNLNNRSRFVILKDTTYSEEAYDNAGAGTLPIVHNHKFVKYKKLNFDMVFNANNNADITDIIKGALFLCFYNREATYPMTVSYSAVVRFTEK